MTAVDNFVRKNILTFPSLFQSRTDVLHHALCVIGSGYDWDKTGKVVYSSRRPVSPWNKDEELGKLKIETGISYASAIIKHFALSEMRKEYKTCLKVVEEIDWRVHERSPIKDFYPQSDYALLMNIPENVTPVWKEACDEMKLLAEQAGWKF